MGITLDALDLEPIKPLVFNGALAGNAPCTEALDFDLDPNLIYLVYGLFFHCGGIS